MKHMCVCVCVCESLDRENTYKSCMKYCLQPAVTNMAMVRSFEVVSNRFNIDKNCIYVPANNNTQYINYRKQ
jgi:hypothetical protein